MSIYGKGGSGGAQAKRRRATRFKKAGYADKVQRRANRMAISRIASAVKRFFGR